MVVTKLDGAAGADAYMVMDRVWLTELRLKVLVVVAQVEVGEATRMKGLKPPLNSLIEELVMVKDWR